jgi:hypothetical protein
LYFLSFSLFQNLSYIRFMFQLLDYSNI